MSRTLLGPIALLVLIAGCTEAPGSDSQSTASTFEPAPIATAAADMGSMSGLVVDDEQLPIPGADVVLVGTGHAAESDAGGRFTFNDLPPSSYTVIANRLGFESAGKKVQVGAGEITNVTLVLRPILIKNETYAATDLKVAYIKASWLYLTYGPWGAGVNDTNLNSLQCDPCRFTIHFEPKPQEMLTETFFKNSVTYPVINNQVWLYYGINDENGFGTTLKNGYWKHRTASAWSEAAVKNAKAGKMGLWVSADLLGINVEQRVETYTSFSYNGPLGNHTALPPA